ncbi:MAG: type II secretion system F family protein, partial [Deltaproteobacteria bacterium]|nr:type II secretion system F family protein [Deltaproteobacteria bacterium]
MPKYEYAGKGPGGTTAKGVIEADNVAQASAQLKQRQITPTSIVEKKGMGSFEIKIPGFGPKVKTKDIVIFTRQFATMIDAGLPLVQCLDILSSQQENPPLKAALIEVKASVEGGSTFADALAKHPKIFDVLFVNLVAAGEIGGILDTILNRLSLFMEKAEKLKGEIKGALTYPIAVIGIAGVIVSGLLIFVVPIFESMFADFGGALPAPTQIVVNMSDFMKTKWWLILGVMAGIYIGLKQYYKTKSGEVVMDGIFLKLPVFGDL